MTARNFVVLNLAERDGNTGPVACVEQGLKRKYPVRSGIKKKMYGQNSVEVVYLFDLIDRFKAGTLKRSELNGVRQKCAGATKIMICIHGTPTDTDHGFEKSSGGAPLCDWKQLGKFIAKLFPARGTVYKVALIMCYGARTSDYRAEDLDHQGMISGEKLKSSFAYKFFRKICVLGNVRMTARTGAVAFDPMTGMSAVEQELSIDARIDKEDYLRGEDIVPTEQSYAQLKKGIKDDNSYKAWVAMEEKFKDDPKAKAKTKDEIIVKNHWGIMRTKRQHQDIMDAHPDKQKYGKLLYAYDPQHGLTIINKYANAPGMKSNQVLYQGPLL